MQKLPSDAMCACSLFSPIDIRKPLKPEISLRPEVSISYAENYFPISFNVSFSRLSLSLAFWVFFVSPDVSLLQKPITEGPQAFSPSVPGKFSPFMKKILRET